MTFYSELFSLESKNAVIIGAGGHLCSEIAKGFHQAGANLVIVDIRAQKAALVAQELTFSKNSRVLHYEADASDKDSLSNLLEFTIEQLGHVDVLINGAGINSSKPFLEIDIQEWNDVFDSQILATMLGCQVFGKHMIKNQSGSIINFSSASADPGLSRAFAYSASKAGIRNLTQNLGREWAANGVRVNALRPGFFPTEWNRKNFIDADRERSILSHTPMGRFGEPTELVGAAVFLASSASSFVTGSELIVDGGFSAMTI